MGLEVRSTIPVSRTSVWEHVGVCDLDDGADDSGVATIFKRGLVSILESSLLSISLVDEFSCFDFLLK